MSTYRITATITMEIHNQRTEDHARAAAYDMIMGIGESRLAGSTINPKVTITKVEDVTPRGDGFGRD